MLCLSCIAQTLLLLIAANGAPVLARKLFGNRYAYPLDGGLLLHDGQSLFGYSKTWRGLLVAILTSAIVASLLGFPAQLGALFGALSMSGDLLASFCKRRLGYAISSRARLLDVFPEALLPTLVLHTALHLGIADAIATAFGFFLLEVSFSPVLYRLRIRNRPY